MVKALHEVPKHGGQRGGGQAVGVVVGPVAVEAEGAELLVVPGVPAQLRGFLVAEAEGVGGGVAGGVLPAQGGNVHAHEVGRAHQRLGLAAVGAHFAHAHGFKMQLFERHEHLGRGEVLLVAEVGQAEHEVGLVHQQAAQVAVFGRGGRAGLGHVGVGVHHGNAHGAVEVFVGQELPVVEVVAAAEQQGHGVFFEQGPDNFAQALVGVLQREAGPQVAQVHQAQGAVAFLQLVEALAHLVGAVVAGRRRAPGAAPPFVEADDGQVGGAPVREGFGEAGGIDGQRGGRGHGAYQRFRQRVKKQGQVHWSQKAGRSKLGIKKAASAEYWPFWIGRRLGRSAPPVPPSICRRGAARKKALYLS